MPANFTSGWLGNGQAAWHGQGVVTEGTLPAREAFETADALFTVEKRELQLPLYYPEPADEAEFRPSGAFGVVRTDTQALLGVVSKQYEIVQNDALLRMAEFIREEADMDTVIVLSDGAKVCFTASLRGAETDIVPGDTVKRRLVGWLGHDGRLAVEPASPISELSAKTHLLLHSVTPVPNCPFRTKVMQINHSTH